MHNYNPIIPSPVPCPYCDHIIDRVDNGRPKDLLLLCNPFCKCTELPFPSPNFPSSRTISNYPLLDPSVGIHPAESAPLAPVRAFSGSALVTRILLGPWKAKALLSGLVGSKADGILVPAESCCHRALLSCGF